MSNVIEKEYEIIDTLSYSQFVDSEYRNKFYLRYPRTSIFNKASRTTVCFKGAMDRKVMYCENCDKTHNNNMDMTIEIREYPVDKDSINFYGEEVECKSIIKNVICKECGSTYDLDDIRIIQRQKHTDSSEIRAVYNCIYNEDEYVKLSVKLCSMVVESAFYFVDNIYKVIFNTETGQTYLFNNPGNKKNKVKPLYSNITLDNYTFRISEFDNLYGRTLIDTEDENSYKLNQLKEMYGYMYEKISNNLGYNPKTLEDYAKDFGIENESDIYKFKILALYNRFPNLNPFSISQLSNSYGYKVDVLKKLRAIKNTAENPTIDLANAYNVKHYDLFEEYFNEGSGKLYWLIYLSEFFEDKEHILGLMDLHNKSWSVFASSPEELDRSLKRTYSLDNAYTILFRHLSKVMNKEELHHLFYMYLSVYDCKSAINYVAETYYYAKKIQPKIKVDMSKLKDILINYESKDELIANTKIAVNYIFDLLHETSHKINSKKYKFKLKTMKEYSDEFVGSFKNNPMVSKLYNEIPHFNPHILSIMLYGKDGMPFYGTRDLIKNDFSEHVDKTNPDILGDIFSKLNIPNVKSLRKKVLSNPRLFSGIAIYSNLFTDVNAINNIVKCFTPRSCVHFDLEDIKNCFNGVKANRYEVGYIFDFAKVLIEAQGETIAAKKIANAYKNDERMYLIDIYPMYRNYLEIYPGEPVDLTGTIKEIHDRLVVLTGGRYHPFTKKDLVPYKYTDSERELEYETNGYEFKLAYNAKELATVGYDLKNCVAGYNHRCRSKDSYVLPVSIDGKYEMCIEVRNSYDENYNFLLIQAKLFDNAPVSEDPIALNAVLEWVKKNNIKDNSSDLKPRSQQMTRVRERQQNVIEAPAPFQPMEFDVADFYPAVPADEMMIPF